MNVKCAADKTRRGDGYTVLGRKSVDWSVSLGARITDSRGTLRTVRIQRCKYNRTRKRRRIHLRRQCLSFVYRRKRRSPSAHKVERRVTRRSEPRTRTPLSGENRRNTVDRRSNRAPASRHNPQSRERETNSPTNSYLCALRYSDGISLSLTVDPFIRATETRLINCGPFTAKFETFFYKLTSAYG